MEISFENLYVGITVLRLKGLTIKELSKRCDNIV